MDERFDEDGGARVRKAFRDLNRPGRRDSSADIATANIATADIATANIAMAGMAMAGMATKVRR